MGRTVSHPLARGSCEALKAARSSLVAQDSKSEAERRLQPKESNCDCEDKSSCSSSSGRHKAEKELPIRETNSKKDSRSRAGRRKRARSLEACKDDTQQGDTNDDEVRTPKPPNRSGRVALANARSSKEILSVFHSWPRMKESISERMSAWAAASIHLRM